MFHAGKPERNVVYAWEGEVAELKAEIERLRAALERVWNDDRVVEHLPQDTKAAIRAALNQQLADKK